MHTTIHFPSHPQINAAGQHTCIQENKSLDDLHFYGKTVIATAELNETSMHSQESCEEDSLDDQIINKNVLFDPTALLCKFLDSFLDFFTYYQDDSWIFSYTPEEHLLHLKMVL
jgi:hypothetical protein